jgi:hypothetical protein
MVHVVQALICPGLAMGTVHWPTITADILTLPPPTLHTLLLLCSLRHPR